MCFRNSSEIDEWHICFRIFLRVTNGIGVFSTFRELRIPYLFPDLGDGQKSWFLVITPIENRDCLRCVLSLFFGSLWFDLSYTYIYIYIYVFLFCDWSIKFGPFYYPPFVIICKFSVKFGVCSLPKIHEFGLAFLSPKKKQK